jgi:photosystem II stability/assembly factor-like uncharacterized protein
MSNVKDCSSRASVTLHRYVRHGSMWPVLACIALSPQLLAKTSDPLAQDATVTSMQRLGPQTGWASNEQTLYWTQESGAQWQDITPPKQAAERIVAVTFTDTANGFVLLASDDPGLADSPLRLASTADAGANWWLTPIKLGNSAAELALSGDGSLAFTDALHGLALLRISGSSNFSRGILLATSDGGQSWKRLPDPPAAGALQFSSRSSGQIVGGPDGNQVYVTADGGNTWKRQAADTVETKQALAPQALADIRTRAASVLADGAVADTSAYSAAQGWALVTAGRCTGEKTGCRQVTQLLSTQDAGGNWTEITPQASPSLQLSPLASAPVSTRKGFDTCAAPGSSSMGKFWSGPFRDVNIYIGGVNRACAQSNLTKSWVSTVSAQGWFFIPTWVGPQAPCSGIGTTFSSTASTARSQGIAQAKSAQAAAKALGLDKTVIYYDMEHYETTASCSKAVKAFVDGWVSEMNVLGFKGGVYGSPINANADWHGLDHNADAVWLASWNGVASVWGISPLSDNLWKLQQRIHQYRGGHNETWNGVTLNIDSDIEDAPVAKP